MLTREGERQLIRPFFVRYQSLCPCREALKYGRNESAALSRFGIKSAF